MPSNFLLHMIYPLWTILNSDMHKVMVLSQMVSWFHWKYDYTSLLGFQLNRVGNSRISS
jgi:hypothetical protein